MCNKFYFNETSLVINTAFACFNCKFKGTSECPAMSDPNIVVDEPTEEDYLINHVDKDEDDDYIDDTDDIPF